MRLSTVAALRLQSAEAHCQNSMPALPPIIFLARTSSKTSPIPTSGQAVFPTTHLKCLSSVLSRGGSPLSPFKTNAGAAASPRKPSLSPSLPPPWVKWVAPSVPLTPALPPLPEFPPVLPLWHHTVDFLLYLFVSWTMRCQGQGLGFHRHSNAQTGTRPGPG